MAVQEGPVFHRLLPGPGDDQPIRITLRDYKAALEHLQLDDAQMRFSRTQFDPGYVSEFETYSHFYWLTVESGTLTLSFKRGDHVVLYRKDNKEERVPDGTSVELNRDRWMLAAAQGLRKSHRLAVATAGGNGKVAENDR